VPGATGTSYSINLLLGPPLAQVIPIGPNAASTMSQIKNSASRLVFFEGNDGWMFDPDNGWGCEIDSWHESSAASMGMITISFADGHAMHWTLADWGAEKRVWIPIDRIDSKEFNAWLSGIFPPGVRATIEM